MLQSLYKSNILINRFLAFSKRNHSATVIFFHGLGDTGPAVRGWMKPSIEKFNINHIRFIFPTAPRIHYAPFNEVTTAWFNKYDLKPDSLEHKESLDTVSARVKSLIDKEESSGISLNRIVVGGFSMGGALALHLGYRWRPGLAGVFALSSYLQNNSSVYEAVKNNKSTPLFMRHGSDDDVISFELGKRTYENLANLGVNINFNVISGMGHDVEDEEIDELLEWIVTILP